MIIPGLVAGAAAGKSMTFTMHAALYLTVTANQSPAITGQI
jgi:hypothetical protein